MKAKEKGLCHFDNVFYPVGGMANICENLSDLFRARINGKEKIVLTVSFQLNSYPHIGTVINFMCAFALGIHLKKELNINVELVFDMLDNVVADTINVNYNTYYISQKNYSTNINSKYKDYLKQFESLLKRLNSLSGISYKIKSYTDFQKIPVIREAVIKMLNNYNEFAEILNPTEKRLHIRTECPICHYSEKKSKNLSIVKQNNHEFKLLETCPFHGEYVTYLKKNNDEFIDLNSQIRDFTKGIYLIEDGKKNNYYGVMVDGGDWGGLWSLRIHAESLMKLGYKELPGRIFTPIIVDWAGTKLSKRLYVGCHAFTELQEGLVNYSKFFECFGEKGFINLWDEVNDWIQTPKKFFRNYSVDYLQMVLKKEP